MADADRDTRLLAVAALWRRALSGGLHAAGCSCMGGFLLTPPSARDLEEDVLDYLLHRPGANDAALTAQLREREAALRAGSADDFLSYLRGLVAALPMLVRDRLLDDLSVTLGSIAGPAAGSSRFACV